MYCTIEELRAEGVTTEQATDDRLTELIGLATNYIDAMTEQWFEPRDQTILLDGNDSCLLMLPVFLISATSVKVDGEDITGYKIYNRFVPDDRLAPAIYRDDKWPVGVQNVEIAGSWGYVDQNFTYEKVTPPRIKRCCMRLVIRDLAPLGDQAGQEDRKRTRIISESTDGHSYTLARLAMFPALTGDPDIDEVLSYYKRSCRVELI